MSILPAVMPVSFEPIVAPFPARTKQVAGSLQGTETQITSIMFTDKILITIVQEGRLAHWVHVPLTSSNPNDSDRRFGQTEDSSQSLPMQHLTATTVLGGASSERATEGELYATQIASSISAKNPNETRLLVIGLGLKNAESNREMFQSILEMVMRCI